MKLLATRSFLVTYVAVALLVGLLFGVGHSSKGIYIAGAMLVLLGILEIYFLVILERQSSPSGEDL